MKRQIQEGRKECVAEAKALDLCETCFQRPNDDLTDVN